MCLEPSLLRMNNLNYIGEMMFQLSDNFSWPSSGPALTYLCYTGVPRAGCDNPGEVLQGHTKNHLPQLAGHSSFDAARVQVASWAANSYWWLIFSFFPPVSPSPSLQGCFESVDHQFVPTLRTAPTQMQDLACCQSLPLPSVHLPSSPMPSAFSFS